MSVATLDLAAPPAEIPPPVVRDMTTADWVGQMLRELEPGLTVTLTGVSWDRYAKLVELRDRERPGLKICYDRGELSVMTISSPHDRLKYYLSRVVDTISEELGLEVVGQGQTSVSREDLERGFEPDAWFYVQNAARMRDRRDLNFAVDPPPDLAVEVELSRDLTTRLPAYAAVGVREIWRHDGEVLTVVELQPDGAYRAVSQSPAFPTVPLALIPAVIAEADRDGSVVAFKQFREALRELGRGNRP